MNDEEAYAKTVVNNTSNALKEPNKAMHKDVFVEYFLPVFSGDKETTDSNGMVGKWIDFAGSAYKPVDLLDNESNVVGTVPGLLRQRDGEELDLEIDINQVISRYGKLQKVSEARGANFLSEALEQIDIPTSDKDFNWDDYKDKDEKETASSNKTNDDDDLVSFLS